MAYRQMWEIEVQHEGLNKYRHIRGSDKYIVEQKATAQKLAWDDMWEKKQSSELKKIEREQAIRNKEEKKELAIIITNEAQKALDDLDLILKQTLSINDAVDWLLLLDQKSFPIKKPSKPTLEMIPNEPKKTDLIYQPKLGFFDKIFSGLRKQKIDNAEKLFLDDSNLWNAKKMNIESANNNLMVEYSKNMELWEKEKANYVLKQESNNKLIHEKKEQYLNKDAGAILDYCEMVLSNSVYPDYFPHEWDVDYQSDSKIIIIDYSLPDIDSIPTLKSVKYIVTRDEFAETHISTTVLNKIYDDLLYQIALRTIHELYEADVVNALESIVFNGWVNSVHKATGQNVNSCIMSLQAIRDDFLAINLEKVDPRACFKQLKGVGSSKLHGLSAVAPIININKEVPSKKVWVTLHLNHLTLSIH